MRWAGLCTGLLLVLPVLAQSPATDQIPSSTLEPTAGKTLPSATRSGREIYQRFRDGLANPHCETGSSSSRWRQHFAGAPGRMVARNDDLLPLFGYVVDALREASLPTEYALIPFVESGYKPGARSPSGPAGLWQMIALTARNHHVPISKNYDGRLSPVDSTKAAVRYLKTLHGMFAGDWRLAVMAYNAGEYRILGALKRSGQKARNARPEQLPGLSDITHAYVRKLHALSCLMEQADDREDWLRALDRPVPKLSAVTVPDDVADLAGWARRSGSDAAQLAQLQRLNPVFGNRRIGRVGSERAPVLAMARASIGESSQPPQPMEAVSTVALPAASAPDRVLEPRRPGTTATVLEPTTARRHIVSPGDNVWLLARRYGIRVADLLQRNGLAAGSVLRPGLMLRIDPVLPASPAGAE